MISALRILHAWPWILGGIVGLIAAWHVLPAATHQALEHYRDQGRAEVRTQWMAANEEAMAATRAAQFELDARVKAAEADARAARAAIKKETENAKHSVLARDGSDGVAVWAGHLGQLCAQAGEPCGGGQAGDPSGPARSDAVAGPAPIARAAAGPIDFPCADLGRYAGACRALKEDHAKLLAFSIEQAGALASERIRAEALVVIIDETNAANAALSDR